jgi:hypothetical protein
VPNPEQQRITKRAKPESQIAADPTATFLQN